MLLSGYMHKAEWPPSSSALKTENRTLSLGFEGMIFLAKSSPGLARYNRLDLVVCVLLFSVDGAVELELGVRIIMMVILAQACYKCDLPAVAGAWSAWEQEVDVTVVFERMAKVVEVTLDKRTSLHSGGFNHVLEDIHFSMLLQQSGADEFWTVRATIALPHYKYAEVCIIISIYKIRNFSHYGDRLLCAGYVRLLAFSVTVVHLFVHAVEVYQRADAPEKASANDQGAVAELTSRSLLMLSISFASVHCAVIGGVQCGLSFLGPVVALLSFSRS